MARVKLIEHIAIHVPAYGLPIGSFSKGHVFEDLTQDAADALVSGGHGIAIPETKSIANHAENGKKRSK